MFSTEDVEVQRLLKLLDQAIHESRRSRREIERSLGMGQGYLGSLFRGRIELKVWHVFRLARELGIDPLTLFFEVSPPEDPSWILKQLGIEAPKSPPLAPALKRKKEERPLTAKEIDELVRRAVGEELGKRGLGGADEPPIEPEEPKGG